MTEYTLPKTKNGWEVTLESQTVVNIFNKTETEQLNTFKFENNGIMYMPKYIAKQDLQEIKNAIVLAKTIPESLRLDALKMVDNVLKTAVDKKPVKKIEML